MDLHLRINDSFGSVLCEPEWSWHPRSAALPDFDLWFVWSGRGQMSVGNRSIDLRPGCIFCLRPGGSYHATHDPAMRLGICYIHFDFIDQQGEVITPPKLPPHFVVLGEIDFYERVLKRAIELAQTGAVCCRAEAHSLLESALHAMWFRASRPGLNDGLSEARETINAIQRFVRENPGELFSVEALAERAGYSSDHFTRLFRQVTGMTPKQFCIRVRMERAQILLRDTGMSVKQVAAALGYADLFFFSHQFSQHIGLSPSTWRAQSQEISD